jgi:Skp family chaperone for outer membrane proteins
MAQFTSASSGAGPLRDGLDTLEQGEPMKRTFMIVAGLAALCTVAYIGNRLAAQQPAAPVQAPAQTRVAVINFLQVLKNYNKAKFYDSELEETLRPYRTKMEDLKKKKLEWQAYLQDPKNKGIPDDQRAAGERSIININRQMEDLEKEGRLVVGKKREQQVVQLYREIDDAVKTYARANGFHLVLSYFEPGNAADMFSGTNIGRKLEGMQVACNAMYFADGMDISGPVVENLNRAYPGTAAAAPNPGQH